MGCVYTFQGAGGLLLDVNARTIEVRRDGATCMYFKAQGTLFASGCWMSRHRRSDETRWDCLHTFQSAGGLCLPRAARCERTGHRGEAGWGNLHTFQGTGDFVCLGLLDVDARTIEARRDGAACIHFKAPGDFVCLGLLDVKAQAIKARRDGGLHVCRDA